ncbi:hypothetical protein [Azospirillum sp.]|uniref:hypothetical protein n=1 Tax=Azospirillum sp. TaxID=34012 RepID=UPI002D30F0B0|nr:hypothetical protein [Azospirillum sp.]HYF88964.1 hypothetical protein [Azospirillum sp.]
MIRVLYTRRSHPGSWLIRAATWGEWSHCDLVCADGSLIGAAAPAGVTACAMAERLGHASAAEVVSYPGDGRKAEAWARTQLGKPYDWLGVIGLGLHRDWSGDERDWWCSEFVGRACQEGGYDPWRRCALRRLTPQQHYALNHPAEPVALPA